MARKSIFKADSGVTSGFFNSLDSMSQAQMSAKVSTGKRLMSRTEIALDILREEVRRDAHEQGFAEGVEAGRAEGLNQTESELRNATTEFVETLQSKTDQAIFAMREWVDASEQTLSELAVAIATQVLAQELRLPHDTITALTKEALAEIRLADTVRIRVNPFDHPAIEARKAELLAISSQLRHVEIVDDESILGGCVIESDAGIIDATIQTRLALVLESIREAA